jgi:two-component system sensor histidine kinase UhpB
LVKRAERPILATVPARTVGSVTEQVAQLEAYRLSARALAARILNAQEGERVRISRELHDDTGQALTLLLVRLQLVENHSAEPAVRHELAELRRLVGETLDGVRRLAVHLGPGVLEDLGLRSAIEWLVDRVRLEAGLHVDLTFEGDCEDVVSEVGVAVFRVAQEALTNVVRHAEAESVRVSLTSHDGMLELEIQDDGRGFALEDARARPGSSIGLFGMTERIALVDGRFEIDSEPGRGTTVRATVPLREEVFA